MDENVGWLIKECIGESELNSHPVQSLFDAEKTWHSEQLK